MFGFKSAATIVAATVTALSSTTVDAALPYKLGELTFFGSGCPANTVAVVPSTDGATISVLFSEFGAKTTNARLRQYKSCNLAVPLDVQPGFTIAVTKVDYRGNAFVPRNVGSTADFSAEYFFAGTDGPQTSQTYRAGYSGDIFLSDSVATAVWSECGASTVFRVNANVVARKTSTASADVQIAIDSADSTVGGFYYKIESKRC